MGAALDLTLSDAVLDYGDRALLLQFDSTAEVLAWTAAVRKAALPGVHDVVPASRTVLVKLESPRHQGATRQRLRRMQVVADDIQTAPPADGADVVIDVVYDGPDLPVVAEHTGLSVAQIIDAHTATPWRVGFGGAIPGFAYLTGGDPRLAIPRRAETRDRVQAGAVALAGEFSGIYPRESPGWWQLIGRTDTVVWDITRPSPALLTPGMWVQFRAA
ncbi:allophanate hydrolase subunit 1 [Mycobacterium sp. 1274756.6]|uniref:5-oxoprolinase subunit B family protein n=1 Tax=Mycobacterium sp. 1274756.6 TaxID=1834076 RepID=UPI0007FDD481|nr:allophanate hydrolase subunit 1 [Mycobacterium sp. 1274756.6]OBJ74199.1 allophanate hydrolase [Mycobacterium sp. 1274756.6]